MLGILWQLHSAEPCPEDGASSRVALFTTMSLIPCKYFLGKSSTKTTDVPCEDCSGVGEGKVRTILTFLASLPDFLEEKTMEVVNGTAPAVVAHIEEITMKFYPHMFETYPNSKNYFNLAHQVTHGPDGRKAAQPFALARAIVRYVELLNSLIVMV